jgi:non-ribosomal peptide synthetase component F
VCNSRVSRRCWHVLITVLILSRIAGVANVIAYMTARMQSFGVTSEDRVLQWSAMHFDMCVLDFWCPTVMGCAAVTATMEDAKSAARVAALIQQHRVAIMDTVPSMCQVQPAMHTCPVI